MSGAPSPQPGAAAWTQIAERGSAAGIWALVWLCRLFGRGAARAVVAVIVGYYVLVARGARRASRAYLRRLGLPHGWRDVYRHCLRFGHCTLDRLFWVTGRGEAFRVETHGSETLAALAREKKGALLLGAHLGSFEAMLGVSQRERLPVNIVGYFANAQLINGVLRRLNPAGAARLIHVAPGMDFILTLKERIEAGELVAILADRVGLGERAAEVDFLGGRVPMPSGPFLLASILRCPVYLTFGIYREPNVYELSCEPFAEQVELARPNRDAAAQAWVQKYADRLAAHCRRAPDNWFNFYDYWREGL